MEFRCICAHLNNMLAIYTHSTSKFSKEFWKWTTRRLMGKYTGPNAVEDSLLRGLKELNIPFVRNQYPHEADTALVLSGVRALKEAIASKKSGIIKKLIAGPNIMTHPLEFGGLISDDAVDIMLVPSKWVEDFWVAQVSELKSKIRVWPSGVKDSPASSRTGQPIIYNKLGDEYFLTHLQRNILVPTRLFTYGAFSRNEYLAALTDAPFMVYLSKSESQGLALQEAWAHDVPTLVNKSTHWESIGLSWDSPQINCPYLKPEMGAVFENPEELPAMIERISSLHPKQYCSEHLSDRVSAQILLNFL